MFDYMHLCVGVVYLELLMHTIGCMWQCVQWSNGCFHNPISIIGHWRSHHYSGFLLLLLCGLGIVSGYAYRLLLLVNAEFKLIDTMSSFLEHVTDYV